MYHVFEISDLAMAIYVHGIPARCGIRTVGIKVIDCILAEITLLGLGPCSFSSFSSSALLVSRPGSCSMAS
jgi:hypothetical protein